MAFQLCIKHSSKTRVNMQLPHLFLFLFLLLVPADRRYVKVAAAAVGMWAPWELIFFSTLLCLVDTLSKIFLPTGIIGFSE